MLSIFFPQNVDQFFEISERMFREVKDINDRYTDNWKEMLAMTMISTL